MYIIYVNEGVRDGNSRSVEKKPLLTMHAYDIINTTYRRYFRIFPFYALYTHICSIYGRTVFRNIYVHKYVCAAGESNRFCVDPLRFVDG